jgi:ADP-ribosylglycohydrolase
MGAAIGDAMGMPVETMTYEQIQTITNKAGITGFVDPLVRKDWLKGLKAGDTTDDWQLTRVVARSLIRTRRNFDVRDCAMEHVLALAESAFGWGKTTENAIMDICDGKRDLDVPLSNPEPGKGCGNGVIMKIAPLAIANFIDYRNDLWLECQELGQITHPDIKATIAAYAVARYMQQLLESPVETSDDALKRLLCVIPDVETVEKVHSQSCELVTDRLKKILFHFRSAESLRDNVGCRFHALDTAAFTIGTFVRHPNDFRAGVLEAVNAGGDTDTNASVVGSLIGLNLGLQAIPEEWKAFSSSFQAALGLGKLLCR